MKGVVGGRTWTNGQTNRFKCDKQTDKDRALLYRCPDKRTDYQLYVRTNGQTITSPKLLYRCIREMGTSF